MVEPESQRTVMPELVEALRDLAVMISEPATIEGILQRVGDRQQ
ncbi:hypothetical protein BH23ACT9_BH23ACT9_03610 [soil metagenome]